MSYAVMLVPKSPSQTWDEALDAAELASDDDDVAFLDSGSWARIFNVTQQVLGAVTDTSSHTSRSASHDSTGIEVSAFPNEVTVSVPYWWTNEEAAATIGFVFDLARELAKATGLEAYDQQIGLPINDLTKNQAIGAYIDMSTSYKSDA